MEKVIPLVGLLGLAALWAIFFGILFKNFRAGFIPVWRRGVGGTHLYARSDNPFQFWTFSVFYAVLGLAAAVALIKNFAVLWAI